MADIRPEHGVNLAKFGLVDTIQVMFNIFEQEPLDSLFLAGAQNNMGFIARLPLDSGALTGTWNAETYKTWGKEGKRHLMYRGNRFAKTLKRIDQIKKICTPYYPDLAEAALRYALHPEKVSLIIPGMRNKYEVDLNVAVAEGKKFPMELVDKLKGHRWKHEFYD